MSFLKSLFGALDPQTSTFTKILQKKRGLQFGPDGSAQGLLYQIGLDKAGDAHSPEAKIAAILKEYVALRSYDLNSQISVIEYRVFGKNCNPTDPNFESLESWMAWRLTKEFPNHRFHAIDGWNHEFFEFAKQRAIEHFV